MKPPRHFPYAHHRPGALLTEAIIASCYELDGDELPAQIVYRAIESIQAARVRLGSWVQGTSLHWRIEQDVFVLVLGLGNFHGMNATSVDGLLLSEDAPITQNVWYRSGRFPTVDRNIYRSCILSHRWGPDIIVTATRKMYHS
jgi:hypothetical protein